MTVFNGANTGFMLLAAALVMIMTPGLAFFYGGLVGRSQRAHDHGPELRLARDHDDPLVAGRLLALLQRWLRRAATGTLHYALLRHVGVHSMYAPSQIPLIVFIAYQMMFAIITPALITGAFANRVRSRRTCFS